jgi:hypothetical protein
MATMGDSENMRDCNTVELSLALSSPAFAGYEERRDRNLRRPEPSLFPPGQSGTIQLTTRLGQSGAGRSVPANPGLPQREPHKAYPQGNDAGADIDKHSVVRS